MLNKTIFAAAAVSLFLGGFQSQALAAGDTVVRDHRTKPIVRDHRTKVKVRDHRTKQKVRDHRTNETVRDHRTERPNEVVKANSGKLSCRLGMEKLWWNGYKSVKAFDCQGAGYGYRARKGNGLFEARMNAFNGRMRIQFIGFAH